MISNSLRIAGNLISLLRSQWWRKDKIRSYQADALVRALTFAVKAVPYYRRLGVDPNSIRSAADLQRFPVLTKQLLQANQADLLADGLTLESCETSRTSGSTGEPTTTAFDRRTWLLCKYTLKIRRLLAYGIGIGKRVLLVSELHPEEIEEISKSGVLGRRLLFGQEHVSIHEPVQNVIPILETYRPNAIYAFPSYVAELLEYCERNDVNLRGTDVVFTSSEVLGSALRARISEAFGAEVCDVYGSTEFKEVAWQCRERRYHVNFESTWVEIVEEGDDGLGTLLLTTLVNRAMPLIRYRVGDRARLGEGPCDCGRQGPWIESVSGREVDMLILPDGRRISPYLLTSIVETDASIRRYQIVQIRPSQLEVRYISPEPDAVDCDSLSEDLGKLLGAVTTVEFVSVSSLPRTPGGKQKVFIPHESLAEVT